MKRIALWILPLVVAAMSLAGCDNSKVGKLKKSIADYNTCCPQQMLGMGSLDNLSYDEDAGLVTFNFTLDDEYFNVMNNSTVGARVSGLIPAMLSTNEAEGMLDLLAECDAGLRAVFKAKMSRKTFEYTVTADEIKDIRSNPLSDEQRAERIIRTVVDNNKAECPMAIEEGITLVDVLDDGTNIVFLYDVDENLYDMDLIQKNLRDMEEENKSDVLSDPLVRQTGKYLSGVDRGITYRYVGNQSGKSVDITLTSAELM